MNITNNPSKLGISTLGLFIVNFEIMSPNWPKALRPTFLNQRFEILKETLKQCGVMSINFFQRPSQVGCRALKSIAALSLHLRI